MPEGTAIAVGASRSSACRCGQSSKPRSASASSLRVERVQPRLARPAPAAASRVVASSASSDKSGRAERRLPARRQRTRSRHCRSASVHGNASRPSSPHRIGERLGRQRRIEPAGRPRFEHDAIEAPLAPRLQARAPARPSARNRARRSAAGNSRCSRASSTGAPRSTSESRASKRSSLATIHGSPNSTLSSKMPRHPAVGELVAARIARMLARDALREGVHQQVAERMRRHARRRLGFAAASGVAIGRWPGRSRPARRDCRRPARDRGGMRQRLPARRPVVAAIAAQRIARLDQRGEVAGQRLFGAGRRRQQHRRQSRMRAERQHAPAERADARRAIERAERAAAIRARPPSRRSAADRRSAVARCPRRPVPAPAQLSSTCAISGVRAGSRRCDCGHRR